MTRVVLVDPSAYTPAYDHALARALAEAGADVELVTAEFPYGSVPRPEGYAVRELFYRHARGPAASRRRRALKLLEHGPDMLALRRISAAADIVHFQWLPVQWLDRHLLPPGPVVLTAHDLLPREPRLLQTRAQRRLYDAVDAVVVHSGYGRAQLVERLGVPSQKVRVIHHGAFTHLTELPAGPLPPELSDSGGAVVLFLGLLRPYKGVDLLLEAWRRVGSARELAGAQLWIVGRPLVPLASLQAAAPPGVQIVPRYVSDRELAACFRRADVLALPYQSTERLDFSGVLATALAFATPVVLSDVGGFGELAAAGAARLVPCGDPEALATALATLLGDEAARTELAAGARRAAQGTYSWQAAATETISLYLELLH